MCTQKKGLLVRCCAGTVLDINDSMVPVLLSSSTGGRCTRFVHPTCLRTKGGIWGDTLAEDGKRRLHSFCPGHSEVLRDHYGTDNDIADDLEARGFNLNGVTRSVTIGGAIKDNNDCRVLAQCYLAGAEKVEVSIGSKKSTLKRKGKGKSKFNASDLMKRQRVQLEELRKNKSEECKEGGESDVEEEEEVFFDDEESDEEDDENMEDMEDVRDVEDVEEEEVVEEADTPSYPPKTVVTVLPRTWPGINKPGGVGKVITCTPATDTTPATVTVKYVMGGTDKEIPVEYVQLHAAAAASSPTRSDRRQSTGDVVVEEEEEGDENDVAEEEEDDFNMEINEVRLRKREKDSVSGEESDVSTSKKVPLGRPRSPLAAIFETMERCGDCVGCCATRCGKCSGCLNLTQAGGTRKNKQGPCLEMRCVRPVMRKGGAMFGLIASEDIAAVAGEEGDGSVCSLEAEEEGRMEFSDESSEEEEEDSGDEVALIGGAQAGVVKGAARSR